MVRDVARYMARKERVKNFYLPFLNKEKKLLTTWKMLNNFSSHFSMVFSLPTLKSSLIFKD